MGIDAISAEHLNLDRRPYLQTSGNKALRKNGKAVGWGRKGAQAEGS